MSEIVLGATVIRRQIGRRFGKLRRSAGLTFDQVAKALDRGRSTIQRIEDGDERVRFRELDVRAMLDLYRASEEDVELLLALTAETRNGKQPRGWWHSYTSTALPDWFQLYVALEDSAETIHRYESELVDGLLQTREYAEELFRIGQGNPDDRAEIERLTTVRLERQSLLTRPRAPHVKLVFNESVIRRPIGGADVMVRQLHHVLTVSQQPNVSVRIVPFGVGAHGGAVAGPFSILDFPDDHRTGEPIEPTLAYVDTLTGAIYLNAPAEVDAYRGVWRDLATRALDEASSSQLIREAMEEYDHG